MDKTFDNRVDVVSNYEIDALDRKLEYWGSRGYKLVSTEWVKDIHGCMKMYLFFTKEN